MGPRILIIGYEIDVVYLDFSRVVGAEDMHFGKLLRKLVPLSLGRLRKRARQDQEAQPRARIPLRQHRRGAADPADPAPES